MDRLVLDACVVINLWAGGVLRSLAHDAGLQLLVVEQVTSEVIYIDVHDDEREQLKWDALGSDGTVTHVVLAGTDELTTFLGLVPRLGDGEAASLAAAQHRGLVLATDDGLALSAAANSTPVVETVTTPDIVSWWADAVGANDTQVGAAIRRIGTRARYRPANSHPLREWWTRCAQRV